MTEQTYVLISFFSALLKVTGAGTQLQVPLDSQIPARFLSSLSLNLLRPELFGLGCHVAFSSPRMLPKRQSFKERDCQKLAYVNVRRDTLYQSSNLLKAKH